MSSSSSSGSARIELRSDTPGVEFSVVDSRFVERGAGVGELLLDVPAGIYEVRERFGDSVETYLITVRADEPFRRSSRHAIPTVAPSTAGSTTSHENHFAAAAEASQSLSLAGADGPLSGVVLMSRALRGHSAGVTSGAPPVRLRTLDGRPVPITDRWESGPDFSITSGRLDPGVYVLRTARPWEPLFEQAVVLCRGWQTLVFFPEGRQGPEPERAAVHMCPLAVTWGHDPHSQLVLEAALAGLAEGRLDISDADINDLLMAKFMDPMLGIVGAHALLVSRNPRMGLYDHVLRNLNDLVPDHPDVAALSQLSSPAVPPEYFSASEPPMLLPSYRKALLPANLTNPAAIVDGSPLERYAQALVERGVWFTWYAEAPPPPLDSAYEFELPMSVGRGPASAPLRKMQNYVDQVAAAEGWTRAEAARRVTPTGVAAACGLPVRVVQRLMPNV